MQTYRCACGNRLFFENISCLACRREVGWCEGCSRITALQPTRDDETANGMRPAEYRCSHLDCGRNLSKCHNYAVENVCNHCYVTPVYGGSSSEAVVAEAEVNRLCRCCALTETIPDLSVEGNREKWARLEAAKRRLLYTLDRLGLRYFDVEPKLSFDFKADVDHPRNEWRNSGPTDIVYTGHANGKITINIREADDAIRETLRQQFLEAHRTLIGHFHHEVGHYYWQLLVQDRQEREFKELFGDHNSPAYGDAMAAYYQKGPREAWSQSFISAYASAHPWEDFAETFALYLDMVSVLDTASHLFKSINANVRSRSVRPLVERFQEVGILVNEFNRTMGLIDLVPEVIAEPVVIKLEYVHKLVKRAARAPRVQPAKPLPGTSPPPQPVLMQQQDLALFEPHLLARQRR